MALRELRGLNCSGLHKGIIMTNMTKNQLIDAIAEGT